MPVMENQQLLQLDQALEKLEQHPVKIILMDCQMPELDGYEATAAIRSRETVDRRVPIVAHTANISDEDRGRCVEAGMDDVLVKPISIDHLRTILARWNRETESVPN